MKSFLVIVAAILSGVIVSGTSAPVVRGQTAPPAWTGPKMRIAVVSFSGAAFKEDVKKDRESRTTTIALPPPADFALGLTEMLTTELRKDRTVRGG